MNPTRVKRRLWRAKMESLGSRCKIVVVGDTQCGKTALLHVFAKDCYPEVSAPCNYWGFHCWFCYCQTGNLTICKGEFFKTALCRVKRIERTPHPVSPKPSYTFRQSCNSLRLVVAYMSGNANHASRQAFVRDTFVHTLSQCIIGSLVIKVVTRSHHDFQFLKV